MSDRVYTKRDKQQGMGFSMDASRAFRIICCCGLVGVLVDFDHIIEWAVWYVSNGETIYSGRFLHTPILIISCIVLFSYCAYIGRLYLKYLLRRGK